MSHRVKKLVTALGREYRNQTQGPGVTLPLPTRYQIEPTNYCNLRCPICPSYALGDKPKWLSRDEFVRIADQLPAGSLVSLYNWGEPFLNPDALAIIREGHQRGLKMMVHSNFNFDPDLLPGIADSGAHVISASIDGATPETYEKFRLKGDFNIAWKNFETLARLIHQRNAPTELRWQFIVNRYNEHELDRAREMVAGLPGAPQLDFIPMGLGQEKVEWTEYSDQELAELKREWLPKNEKYLMPVLTDPGQEAVIEAARCSWLWDSMTISVDGRVTPCCHTYQEKHAFGNLNENSVEEIWNGTAYTTSRRHFLDPDYDGCESVCSRCPNYLRVKLEGPVTRHLNFIGWMARRAVAKLGRAVGAR